MARISVAAAKAKGRLFQQTVAKLIASTLGLVYGTDQDVSSRGMGQQGTDIILSAKAKARFPYAVECKNVEKLNFWGAIRQARANNREGMSWLLLIKKNREIPVAVLELTDFMELIRDADVTRNRKEYRRDVSRVDHDFEQAEAGLGTPDPTGD